MGLAIALTDPAPPLVVDASAIINVLATGHARQLIAALPHRFAIVNMVLAELEAGRARGRDGHDRLKELLDDGLVDLVELSEAAETHFEELVVGPAVSTLDDGEAATIAWAAVRGCAAVIDERKATRICRERFPELHVCCTVDLLIHPAVGSQLGQNLMGTVLFNALQGGRMGVPQHHLGWVTALLGPERVALCRSLPRSTRSRRPGLVDSK